MIFLSKEQVAFMQHANIERFGGAHGLRDDGAFESAIAAAENRHYYEDADAVICAATYGFHLCQAHAFIDGNKRVAAGSMLIFLELNGVQHDLSEDDVISIFLRIASGEMTRDVLETFFRAHVR